VALSRRLLVGVSNPGRWIGSDTQTIKINAKPHQSAGSGIAVGSDARLRSLSPFLRTNF
jgi:hypothetical protein